MVVVAITSMAITRESAVVQNGAIVTMIFCEQIKTLHSTWKRKPEVIIHILFQANSRWVYKTARGETICARTDSFTPIPHWSFLNEFRQTESPFSDVPPEGRETLRGQPKERSLLPTQHHQIVNTDLRDVFLLAGCFI